jgi:hypothetical protein
MMTTTTRPIADRLAEAGLPYEIEQATGFWSVFASGDKVPVIAFADNGVFVGYHPREEAEQIAATVRRKRGVERVVIVTATVDL